MVLSAGNIATWLSLVSVFHQIQHTSTTLLYRQDIWCIFDSICKSHPLTLDVLQPFLPSMFLNSLLCHSKSSKMLLSTLVLSFSADLIHSVHTQLEAFQNLGRKIDECQTHSAFSPDLRSAHHRSLSCLHCCNLAIILSKCHPTCLLLMFPLQTGKKSPPSWVEDWLIIFQRNMHNLPYTHLTFPPIRCYINVYQTHIKVLIQLILYFSYVLRLERVWMTWNY